MNDGQDRRHNQRGLEFTLFSAIERAPRKTWQIEGFQGEGELVCDYGAPSAGKSTYMIDKFAHVADGRAWFDRRVTRCAVLHVAVERLAVVKRRYAAWRLHHGVDDLPLAVLGGTVNLRTSFDDAKHIVDACRRLEDLKAFSVGLIGIETVNRVLAGGNENDSGDMGALIDKVAFIQQETGATVELAHHIPQEAERMRGHGSLLGAMDVTQLIRGSGNGDRTCTIVKANDGPEGEQVSFRFHSVELSRNDDGTLTTAPVIVPTEAQSVADTAYKPKLPRNMQTMLSILADAGPNGLTQEQWNEQARDAGVGVKRRADLTDNRLALKAKGLVHTYADRWHVTLK